MVVCSSSQDQQEELKEEEKLQEQKEQQEQEEGQEEQEQYEELPSIEELLKLPDQKELMLDAMDKEIVQMTEDYDIKMAKVDKAISDQKIKRREWEVWQEENAALGLRIRNMSEVEFREVVEQNTIYLKGVCNGEVPSVRHSSFHQSIKTRVLLIQTAFTEPFSEEQVDLANYVIVSRVWNGGSSTDRDYISKVLLPECLIKCYSDIHQVQKQEAEIRMKYTLVEEYQKRQLENKEDTEETSKHQTSRDIAVSTSFILHCCHGLSL